MALMVQGAAWHGMGPACLSIKQLMAATNANCSHGSLWHTCSPEPHLRAVTHAWQRHKALHCENIGTGGTMFQHRLQCTHAAPPETPLIPTAAKAGGSGTVKPQPSAPPCKRTQQLHTAQLRKHDVAHLRGTAPAGAPAPLAPKGRPRPTQCPPAPVQPEKIGARAYTASWHEWQ